MGPIDIGLIVTTLALQIWAFVAARKAWQRADDIYRRIVDGVGAEKGSYNMAPVTIVRRCAMVSQVVAVVIGLVVLGLASLSLLVAMLVEPLRVTYVSIIPYGFLFAALWSLASHELAKEGSSPDHTAG